MKGLNPPPLNQQAERYDNVDYFVKQELYTKGLNLPPPRTILVREELIMDLLTL